LEENKKIENLESLISRLRPYLRRYLEEQGVDINDKGWFRCINPKHKDEHPSCHFVPDTEEQVFHCFSCGGKGSITDAAYLLEDKPLNGVSFVSDNLVYLAEKYGIDYQTSEISPEKLHIRRVFKAYEAAAEIIADYQPLDYITKRNWAVSL
jgi:DNA primase